MKVGINGGSGQRPFKSTPEVKWINVDCQEKSKPDLVRDLTNLSGVLDEAVDYYILHHVLEHFGCGEGEGVIAEAYRVLKPGGSLIVTVPDLKALAQAWLLGRLDTETYIINLYGAYMGDEVDRHKFGFVYQTLGKELKKLPWTSIATFDWRSIPGADIARDFWILGMEVVK